MRTWLSIAAAGVIATILVALPGCPHDEYVVQMWPRGQQLERTVVVTHEEGGAVIKPGEAAATQPGQRNVPRHSRDLFASSIPDQLDGGSGRYAFYPSELGSLFLYTERIRGSDDQATVLETQFKAVDRLIDLLLAWTKRKYGKFAEYPKLAAFLDGALRKDLKNLGVIAFMGDAGHRLATTGRDRDFFTHGAAARVIQYAVERDYLAKGDLARLMRGQADSDTKATLEYVRDLLVRKAGLTDKAMLDAVCFALANFAKNAESFDAFVRQTPQFREALAVWRASNPPPQPKEAATRPDLSEILLVPAFQTVQNLIDLGTPDEFSITLHTGRSPVLSNGVWDRQAGTITWSFNFPKERQSVPVVCYAVWVEPDEAAQKAHFGRVLLDGDKLAEYCLWRSALSPVEAAEWAGVLARLKPGIDYDAILKDFRFTGQEREPHGATLIRNAASQPERD